MKNNHLKNVLTLLLACLFISTSGVLGRYISLPTEIIIWSRAFLAMIFLYFFSKYKKINLSIKNKKDYQPFFLGGLFMCLHWVTYFYALKLSNVALGVLSVYTFPIIIAVLEPFYIKTKFNPIYIVFGILVLIGLYILMPSFNIENTQVKGILFGLFSALCYAIRILIFKQFINQYNGTTLMFYQTVIITVILFPSLFFMDLTGFVSQLPYLFLLAIVTTAIGHSLLLHSLNFFSASTASILSSLQPIFSIILGAIILHEIPSKNIYIGGSLILLTVAIEGIRSNKRN